MSGQTELTPKEQLIQEKKGVKLLKDVLKSLKNVNSNILSINEVTKVWSEEELAVIVNQPYIQSILSEISAELTTIDLVFKKA